MVLKMEIKKLSHYRVESDRLGYLFSLGALLKKLMATLGYK